MTSTVGVIFSSINDDQVPELTKVRSKGSIPYGGRYRLVDFALSNMVNTLIALQILSQFCLMKFCNS